MKNKIIILAAGKGSRMKSDLPKPLIPINNRAMIKYLLDSIRLSQIDPQPIIVVSPSGQEIMRESLGDYNLSYAIQTEALGTGQAVSVSESLIPEEVENVLVLYGDQPFISQESMKKILKIHQTELSMLTVKLDDFKDWRQAFYHWGRVVREEEGEIREIIEFKDAKEEEKNILELNPAIFCFNRIWLFDNIKNLKNNNNQAEYYLTDLVKMAFDQGIKISSCSVSASEVLGVNNPEDLKIVEKLIKDEK